MSQAGMGAVRHCEVSRQCKAWGRRADRNHIQQAQGPRKCQKKSKTHRQEHRCYSLRGSASGMEIPIIPGEVSALPKQGQSGGATTNQTSVVHHKPCPKGATAEGTHLLLGLSAPHSCVREGSPPISCALGQQCLLEGPADPPDCRLSKPPQ